MVYCSNAVASGDSRDVQEPQSSQPICTTIYPSQKQDSVATTKLIQMALNSCPSGKAVRLSGGTVAKMFLSGPIQVPSGVFLRIDADVTLAADSNPNLYDLGAGTCGTIDKKGNGCRPFITLKNNLGGGIQGDGVIDGQGGEDIAGKKETWWAMARRAQSISGGKQNAPRLIQVENSKNITIHGVKIRNSPNFNIVLSHVSGATIWGVIIDTPASARNTDGIDPGASEDITIARCFIRTGDDNIAIKAGAGPSKKISIIDNHLYSGHGMSIGSEVNSGVSDVLVKNMTIDGATSGLRIKSNSSKGGLVSDIEYINVCMRNNRRPIDFDTHYSKGESGDKIPQYKNIQLNNVKSSNETSGTVVLRGYDSEHPIFVNMNSVKFSENTVWSIDFANLTTLGDEEEPNIPGVKREKENQPDMDCGSKWVPFPQ